MEGRNTGMGKFDVGTVEVIDLAHYWQVIRRQLSKILILSVIITIIAALASMVMTPVYRATATLLIESQEAKVL